MMKNSGIWLPFMIAVTLVIGVIIGSALNKGETQIIVNERPSEHFSKLDRVGQILRYVDAKYVDSIDLDKLSMDAINAIFNNLDPHSFFIPPTKVRQFQSKMEGKYRGIGIEVAMYNDTVAVLKVLSGGPAQKAGISAGDKILKVGATAVSGVEMELDELSDLFYGKAGSVVKLLIDKYGREEKWYKVVRDDIPTPAIENVIDIDSCTIYLAIREFNAHVAREFIDSLYAHGADTVAKDIIIDLRNNPGGYVDESIKILSQLIEEKGLPLIKTKGYRVDDFIYKTSGDSDFSFNYLAVLINEYTASASEIVAAALQDYDAATIIGRRSFGKGLVQNQYKLSDGSAIRLTIARYYTPSGRLIQKPYDSASFYNNYNDEVVRRIKSGELLDKRKIPIVDSTKYYTRNRRVIYSSEGVIPDIFIPLDTAWRIQDISGIDKEVRGCSFEYARKHHIFDADSLPSYTDKQLDSIILTCPDYLGKDLIVKKDILPYLRGVLMRNLLFAQAGSRAAILYDLKKDPAIIAALRFKENAEMISNVDE